MCCNKPLSEMVMNLSEENCGDCKKFRLLNGKPSCDFIGEKLKKKEKSNTEIVSELETELQDTMLKIIGDFEAFENTFHNKWEESVRNSIIDTIFSKENPDRLLEKQKTYQNLTNEIDQCQNLLKFIFISLN